MGFVRCKGPDGAEFTAHEDAARAMGDGVKVLTSKPAVDVNGRPLPPKKATDLAGRERTQTPSESWTHRELDDHATAHGIDLGGATTKSDKLAAIDAANHQEA
jgi:hypothetical protein